MSMNWLSLVLTTLEESVHRNDSPRKWERMRKQQGELSESTEMFKRRLFRSLRCQNWLNRVSTPPCLVSLLPAEEASEPKVSH